jgi:hypothetical protein
MDEAESPRRRLARGFSGFPQSRGIVRHEPNLSSGGNVTEHGVQVFLDRTGSSPENLALRALRLSQAAESEWGGG